MSTKFLFDADSDLLLISLAESVPPTVRGLRITASIPGEEERYNLGLAKIDHRGNRRMRPDAVVRIPRASRVDVHVAAIAARSETDFAFGSYAISRENPDVAMSEATRWALSRSYGGMLHIDPEDEDLSTLLSLSSVLSRHAGSTIFPAVTDLERGQPARIAVGVSLAVPEDDPDREHMPWEQLHIDIGHDPVTVLPETLEVMVMHFLASEDVAPMLEGKKKERKRATSNWRRVKFEEANKGTFTRITLPAVDTGSVPSLVPKPMDHPFDFLDRVVIWTDPVCEVEFHHPTGERDLSQNGMVSLLYLCNGRFARDQGAFNDVVRETYIGSLADVEIVNHWSGETPELGQFLNLANDQYTFPVVQYTYASFAEMMHDYGGAASVLEIDDYADRPMLFELLSDQDLYRAAASAGIGMPPADEEQQEDWLRALAAGRFENLIAASTAPTKEKEAMREKLSGWVDAIDGSAWKLLELTLFSSEALQMLRASVLPDEEDIGTSVHQFSRMKSRGEDLARARARLPEAFASVSKTGSFIRLSSIDNEIDRIGRLQSIWYGYLTSAAVDCGLLDSVDSPERSLIEGVKLDDNVRLNTDTASRAARVFERRIEGTRLPFGELDMPDEDVVTALRKRISRFFAKVIDQECQEIDELVAVHRLQNPADGQLSLASSAVPVSGFAEEQAPFSGPEPEVSAGTGVVSRFPIIRRWKMQLQREIRETTGPRSSVL